VTVMASGLRGGGSVRAHSLCCCYSQARACMLILYVQAVFVLPVRLDGVRFVMVVSREETTVHTYNAVSSGSTAVAHLPAARLQLTVVHLRGPCHSCRRVAVVPFPSSITSHPLLITPHPPPSPTATSPALGQFNAGTRPRLQTTWALDSCPGATSGSSPTRVHSRWRGMFFAHPPPRHLCPTKTTQAHAATSPLTPPITCRRHRPRSHPTRLSAPGLPPTCVASTRHGVHIIAVWSPHRPPPLLIHLPTSPQHDVGLWYVPLAPLTSRPHCYLQ
jgi:hypothetical protein